MDRSKRFVCGSMDNCFVLDTDSSHVKYNLPLMETILDVFGLGPQSDSVLHQKWNSHLCERFLSSGYFETALLIHSGLKTASSFLVLRH